MLKRSDPIDTMALIKNTDLLENITIPKILEEVYYRNRIQNSIHLNKLDHI